MSVPYIPLYVADYEADTAHLTLEEDGAYTRLLRLCWRTPGCSVPDDPKWIMRKMRVSADDYYRVIEPIIDEFFTRGMGRVFSARLQVEMERVESTHKARSIAGKKGNEKRWSKVGGKSNHLKTNKNNNRKATVLQSQPEPEPEPLEDSPLTPREILCTILREETADDFISHRKAMKKPVTEVAARRLVKAVSNHPDPDSVFDASIANGWQGVFPDKRIENDKSSKQSDRLNAFIAGARGSS